MLTTGADRAPGTSRRCKHASWSRSPASRPPSHHDGQKARTAKPEAGGAALAAGGACAYGLDVMTCPRSPLQRQSATSNRSADPRNIARARVLHLRQRDVPLCEEDAVAVRAFVDTPIPRQAPSSRPCDATPVPLALITRGLPCPPVALPRTQATVDRVAPRRLRTSAQVTAKASTRGDRRDPSIQSRRPSRHPLSLAAVRRRLPLRRGRLRHRLMSRSVSDLLVRPAPGRERLITHRHAAPLRIMRPRDRRSRTTRTSSRGVHRVPSATPPPVDHAAIGSATGRTRGQG